MCTDAICCKTSLHIKYIVLIALVSVFFIAELVVGIIANSITLQTDAFHMLADLFALLIGFVALLVINRKNHRYTYGWVRAEIIAGMINSVFLLSVAFMMLLENITKFIELSEELSNKKLDANINLVLIVASAGLAVNLIGIALFYNEQTSGHGHSHGGGDDHGHDDEEEIQNFAQSAVLLHIIGDTLGSVLVIISSIIIKYVDGNWKYYLDPVGSLLIILFISVGSGKLLWQCIKILIHRWSGNPTNDIKDELLTVIGVDGIHEFHVWPLDNKVTIASMHVKISSVIDIDEVDDVISDVKVILHSHGIHSSTIQPEWDNVCIEPSCLTDCSHKQCCQ